MGEISRIKKIVREPIFRQRVEKNKKGKGSYTRKGKSPGVNEDSKEPTLDFLESSLTKEYEDVKDVAETFEERSTGSPEE